jgi:hypothetical protein
VRASLRSGAARASEIMRNAELNDQFGIRYLICNNRFRPIGAGGIDGDQTTS